MRKRSAFAALVTVVVVASIASGAGTGPKSFLVSRSSADPKGGADTAAAVVQAVSGSGRFVVFESDADNLIPGFGDLNSTGSDVFVWDKEKKTVRLVSHQPGSPTSGGNGESGGAEISADGRYVAFFSYATNLVPGFTDLNSGFGDLFLWERATDTIRVVSRDAGSATAGANTQATQPSISDDGSRVAFESAATNLVSGFIDHNVTERDVYVFDRASGSVQLVSRSTTSAVDGGNDESTGPMISGDGSDIAFRSQASDLVTGFTGPSTFDTFVFRVSDGTTEVVSRSISSSTTGGNGSSIAKDISRDGSRILFLSLGTDHIAAFADTNGSTKEDAFVLDTDDDSTTLVSRHLASAADGAADDVAGGSMDAAGRRVVFETNAPTVIQPFTDANAGEPDIYLFDLATQKSTLVTHPPGSPNTGGNGESLSATIAEEGGAVVFKSESTDLISGFVQGPLGRDAYRYVIAKDKNKLVSVAAADPKEGAGVVADVIPSASGGRVAFNSPGVVINGFTDNNTTEFDVYLRVY